MSFDCELDALWNKDFNNDEFQNVKKLLSIFHIVHLVNNKKGIEKIELWSKCNCVDKMNPKVMPAKLTLTYWEVRVITNT